MSTGNGMLQLKRSSSSSSSPRAAAVKSTPSAEHQRLGLQSAWIQRLLPQSVRVESPEGHQQKLVLPQLNDDRALGRVDSGSENSSVRFLSTTPVLQIKENSLKKKSLGVDIPSSNEYLARTFDDGRTRKGGETSKGAGLWFSNVAEDVRAVDEPASRGGFRRFETDEWRHIQKPAFLPSLRIPGKIQAEARERLWIAEEQEPPTLPPLRIVGKTMAYHATETSEERPTKRSSSSSITRSLPAKFFDEILASQSDASDTKSLCHDDSWDNNSQQEVDSLRTNSVESSRFWKSDSPPSCGGVSLEKTGGLAEPSFGFQLPNLRPADLKKHARGSTNFWLQRWIPAQARTGENPVSEHNHHAG